jgi:two-component system chemotaxis response regulator CheB
MVEAPTPIVIVTASIDGGQVEASMHALRMGALTLIGKPVGPAAPDFPEVSRQFLTTVKAMSQVRVVRHWPAREHGRSPVPRPALNLGPRARVVAVAASTGGPAALCQLLAELPADFPVPVLVVQHIALGFLSGFAAWLNTNLKLRVRVAEPAETPVRHTIYLPPDDHHLGIESGRLVVAASPPVGGFRPSASYLFSSVARAFGDQALAVVLTGMGQDGLEGLREIRAAGGQILVQDEASSVVYGMPGAAARAGLADAIVPLKELGGRLLRSVRFEEPRS